MKSNYKPGDDAKAISRIARQHFERSYRKMFEAHGWRLEDGQQYMHQASSRIRDQYGSIAAFEKHFDAEGDI